MEGDVLAKDLSVGQIVKINRRREWVDAKIVKVGRTLVYIAVEYASGKTGREEVYRIENQTLRGSVTGFGTFRTLEQHAEAEVRHEAITALNSEFGISIRFDYDKDKWPTADLLAMLSSVREIKNRQ